jgi:hypothetical protein
MSEHGSRRKFTKFLAHITDEQRVFVDADGRARYPELTTIGTYGWHISPAIRDIIDFARAHYPMFKAWIENERNTP